MVGEAVGGAVGGVVVLAVIGWVIYLVSRRRRRSALLHKPEEIAAYQVAESPQQYSWQNGHRELRDPKMRAELPSKPSMAELSGK